MTMGGSNFAFLAAPSLRLLEGEYIMWKDDTLQPHSHIIHLNAAHQGINCLLL